MHKKTPAQSIFKVEISLTDIFDAFENKWTRNTLHVIYSAGSIT